MRVVLYKMNSSGKIVKDYLTRKEAVTAYYEICDSKGYNYGKPTFKYEGTIKVQDGMETGGIGHDLKIKLYFQ
ncbi:MAG: hypothetical protein ACK5DE_13995 [Bacteroidota bacterium]|jgi:hypothetical protein